LDVARKKRKTSTDGNIEPCKYLTKSSL